jgi:rod shape-determining protein MreC
MKKFNLLALILFLGAVAAVLTIDSETKRLIQERTLAVFAPFIHGSARVEQAVNSVTSTPLPPEELAARVEQLRIEVQRYRIMAQKYDELVVEVEQLRRVLEFKNASPFKLTAARVIKRPSATW